MRCIATVWLCSLVVPAITAGQTTTPVLYVGGEMRGRAERPLVRLWSAARTATLVVDVGLKSEGFVPGEPLSAGPVLRVGIGLPLTR